MTAAIDYQTILATIQAEVQPLLAQGKVASYIPELSTVSPQHFGMAVYCLNGETYSIGDARQKFSLQSVTKLFALALAFSREGDAIWARVGREPSGNPFNSLVQLEYERGKPRNPFINAGALVINDILSSRFVQSDIAILQFARMIAAQPQIDFDMTVAHSERETAHRNYAIAHLMKDFGNLHNPVKSVIDSYCRHCSITMTCAELAGEERRRRRDPGAGAGGTGGGGVVARTRCHRQLAGRHLRAGALYHLDGALHLLGWSARRVIVVFYLGKRCVAPRRVTLTALPIFMDGEPAW